MSTPFTEVRPQGALVGPQVAFRSSSLRLSLWKLGLGTDTATTDPLNTLPPVCGIMLSRTPPVCVSASSAPVATDISWTMPSLKYCCVLPPPCTEFIRMPSTSIVTSCSTAPKARMRVCCRPPAPPTSWPFSETPGSVTATVHI